MSREATGGGSADATDKWGYPGTHDSTERAVKKSGYAKSELDRRDAAAMPVGRGEMGDLDRERILT